MTNNKVYIPTFISSIDYKPARVLPHIYFYNGTVFTDNWYVEENNSGSVQFNSLNIFPYFDNYQGNFPTTSSLSLLFFNETAPYGDIPNESLYSTYWSDYVSLLYNPRTRLFEASAIIPLADYFKIELNDIVEWRGNYYHLRAINDYNLSNGECNIQLLGPVLKDTMANVLPVDKCKFDFSIEDGPTPTSSLWDVTSCDGITTLYGVSFDTTSSLSASQVIRWGTPAELEGCWTLANSTASVDLTGSIVYGIYVDCETCSGSIPPSGSCDLSCSSNLYLTYTGNDYYQYPTSSICSTVSSSFSINWTSYERPNRIAVYDNSGLIASTGWVGDVDYSGPWGLSIHTATNGTLTGTFSTSAGRYLLVEAGGGGGVLNDDACSITLNCG